ncbi:MAG TPA: Gfo/Idh/MocA family oxidoreductase [Kiritimatiellia bacterium]|nr:Gfo/Idh/MocA family oxidoreductase [Kiritimatiellia bacterium]HPS05911.1 Gfo/Idh/MocA family oxidoreductase [Kiritimatiellia bacterium]
MKTTRRDFLKLIGTASGGAAFNIVPSHVLGRNAPGGKVALGMIGVGGMGTVNLEAFLGLDDVVVRAVCDVNRDKMAETRARVDRHYGNRGCEAVKDYRELCARPDIDAVMIATPDHMHAAVGIAAASAGKDIYGETPFTHAREEGESLLDAVGRNRCVWQTGSWQRSQAPFRRAVAAVRAGRIGRIARVEVGLPGGGRGPAARGASARPPAALDWKAWQGDVPHRAYPGVCDFHWRWVSAWGGGILADWIGHHGDIALWGAGKEMEDPVSVEGCGTYPRDGVYDTATAFRFRCSYRDGLELSVADGGQLGKGVGVRWIGRDGAWVWVTRGALEASDPAVLADVDDRALGRCVELHRDFIDCVRTRRPALAPAAPAHHAACLGHFGEDAMRG